MLINLFVNLLGCQPTKQAMMQITKMFIALILMLVSTSMCISQEWNAARITVLYGSDIPFNFNTLDKIKNGVEIATGTRFGISLADSSKVGHDLEGFELNFRSFNGQPNIKGDVNVLPLNRIRVKAESGLGLGGGISEGYENLTTNWVRLFSYTKTPWNPPGDDLKWSDNQLIISYECGKPITDGGNGSLMGESPDYYNVEIEFELVPIGPGF